ncbi:MAG: DUF2935 domain-containing protein [Clostridium sp.]|nr:DUF2935 domain-containing protein [Clostridium sp.]
MADKERYVVLSLELHLFFARIMKEHALFLEAGFTPANKDLAQTAGSFKQKFETLLRRAVSMSDGIVSRRVLASGEILTEFTTNAEIQTQRYTGISIDKEITAMESALNFGEPSRNDPVLRRQVGQLNQTALSLLDGLIAFKEKVLSGMLRCRIFTVNYPLLIEHIIREAKLYRTFIRNIETGRNADEQSMRQTELFWNQIMMEHAQFIRGLLDPTEDDLIKASNTFSQEYSALLSKSRMTNDAVMLRQESLKETMKFRDFKTAGVQGIENCRIRSIILPLLADHVLREANHYIRLLSDRQ